MKLTFSKSSCPMCQVGSPRRFGHQRDCHRYHSSCERATRMAHPWCATHPRSGRNAAGLQGKWTAEKARALPMPGCQKRDTWGSTTEQFMRYVICEDVYIHIYIYSHPCRKMHTQSDLLISVNVIQEMGKYGVRCLLITPSHKKLVKVGLMRRTSQEPHFWYVCNSDSIFRKSQCWSNFDPNIVQHQQEIFQCHLLPVTSSFTCNSSKMPREGSTICQWCVRRSQQSPEDL